VKPQPWDTAPGSLSVLTPAVRTQVQPPGRRWVLVRTTETESGRVELRVQDPGKGTQSNLAQVFEPFFRTKGECLGMELSIRRSIIRARGSCGLKTAMDAARFFIALLPIAQQATVAAGL
jgi:C4-dicarboxylate-specific signal transduction histidine kinase